MFTYKTCIAVFGLVILALVASAEYENYEGYGEHQTQEYHEPAQYSFEYKVHDPITGDEKSQHETREGDKVTGYYTMKEADGTTREVHYTADSINGFKAVVQKSGQATNQDYGYGATHEQSIHHY